MAAVLFNGGAGVVDGVQFQRVLKGESVTPEFDAEYPFYPLNSPGMPLPGNTFVEAAMEMGDQPPMVTPGSKAERRLLENGPALNYLYRRALYDPRFSMRVKLRATYIDAPMLPGHLYGQSLLYQSGGPRQARIMVIYKCPTREDMNAQAHMASDAASVLNTAFGMAGVFNLNEWYVTSVVKWPVINPQSNTIPQSHKDDNAILLEQELRLVCPDFILCLGSEAVKAILGPTQNIRDMLGRVATRTINLTAAGQQSYFKTARVMVAESPSAVAAVPEKMEDFSTAVATFVRLTNGIEVGQQETGLRHINVYKQRQLREIVNEIRNDPDPWRRVIAVDGEWDGSYPTDPGAYLRTIQFSSAHKEGITVVLRHQNGAPAFKPSIAAAITELQRLLLPDPAAGWKPRIGGHFLRADLPWLINAGLDLREGYAPPANMADMRYAGGFETLLQCHAVDETALFGLTEQTVKLTTAPAYDMKVRAAVTERCKELDIKKDQLEGYGFLPQWILHPEPTDPEWGYNYASLDADCTRRICMRHMEPGGLLDSDQFGNSSWEPYFISHRASLGVLEMEMNGITVDFERVDKLALLFVDVHNRLLEHFRKEANWPRFNPASVHHKVEFLFGERYSAKIDKITGERKSVRPAGALSLYCTPIKTTGNKTKLWEQVAARNEEAIYSPSTDKEVLGILGYDNPLIMLLRDIVFIAQTLKGVLRAPQMDKQGGFIRSETGNFVYNKGLASLASQDGKVRTRIRQTMETGRASSSRPNLQAISSRREADYRRILGYWEAVKDSAEKEARGQYLEVLGQPCYAHPIRSILKASPGYVLVEADYTGAELAAIAWLSGDPRMIEHVRRNVLPEDHPDYYDIHSNQAVNAFKLTCAPTKTGLKSIGKSQLRVAAKNVIFGVPYGRGAEAISRQCQEEGVDASADECQVIIDAYYAQYPLTRPFLDSCEERTQNPRWLAGSYGRYRRFQPTRNRAVESQRRQGKNFPIQNCVADAVWTAINNFREYRTRPDCVPYRLLMQVHDSLLFEVAIPGLSRFIVDDLDAAGNVVRNSILRECMIERVPVWPRSLDNRPIAVDAPYHFGIDFKVQLNWGETISEQAAIAAGIPAELVA
jgi:uracil-DNA glycosylase family 4